MTNRIGKVLDYVGTLTTDVGTCVQATTGIVSTALTSIHVGQLADLQAELANVDMDGLKAFQVQLRSFYN